eukprot:scaffold15005_cov112-Isochrysis_galbana.AAC.6
MDQRPPAYCRALAARCTVRARLGLVHEQRDELLEHHRQHPRLELGAVRAQVGALVDLDQPRLERLIKYKVEPINLKRPAAGLGALLRAAHRRGGDAAEGGQDVAVPRAGHAKGRQLLTQPRRVPQGGTHLGPRRLRGLRGRRTAGRRGRRLGLWLTGATRRRGAHAADAPADAAQVAGCAARERGGGELSATGRWDGACAVLRVVCPLHADIGDMGELVGQRRPVDDERPAAHVKLVPAQQQRALNVLLHHALGPRLGNGARDAVVEQAHADALGPVRRLAQPDVTRAVDARLRVGAVRRGGTGGGDADHLGDEGGRRARDAVRAVDSAGGPAVVQRSPDHIESSTHKREGNAGQGRGSEASGGRHAGGAVTATAIGPFGGRAHLLDDEAEHGAGCGELKVSHKGGELLLAGQVVRARKEGARVAVRLPPACVVQRLRDANLVSHLVGLKVVAQLPPLQPTKVDVGRADGPDQVDKGSLGGDEGVLRVEKQALAQLQVEESREGTRLGVGTRGPVSLAAAPGAGAGSLGRLARNAQLYQPRRTAVGFVDLQVEHSHAARPAPVWPRLARHHTARQREHPGCGGGGATHSQVRHHRLVISGRNLLVPRARSRQFGRQPRAAPSGRRHSPSRLAASGRRGRERLVTLPAVSAFPYQVVPPVNLGGNP